MQATHRLHDGHLAMQNPYEAPVAESVTIPPVAATLSPAEILRRGGVWTLICAVTAVPSFIWGFGTSQQPQGAVAMMGGVLLFALAYTAIDAQWLHRPFRGNPAFRRAVIWGFGMRLFASLVFPLGMFIDLFPGLLSVSLIQTIFIEGGGIDPPLRLTDFMATVATTVVQGVLLNCELWVGVLSLYGVLILAGVPRWPAPRSEADRPTRLRSA